ncbi:protein translocase subunit SecF [Geoalkalibacter halelectricus]|uniref:Protein-export membrane protein SecF n=1 Tax=Geoalkalibacter halelectricus TaxID=2847045 RepID=A0ABY5ZLA3_9BACT|nr:protein translocase subunit SecF [Geoalkalibacter halelectricus]MDO3379428.1 protein translocase subunit SecF [Geoalkalibacter halelectricus]UWZ78695.1 protein translocase subunit SecF [Geoalkalibacter halelectricus]
MRLIKSETNIDFIGKRKLAVIFSLAMILIGVVSLIAKGGPNYGIDFAGGMLVQVKFEVDTNPAEIREALAGVDLGPIGIQQFGDEPNEFLIRTQTTSAELEGLAQQVDVVLEQTYGSDRVELRRAEMVGPQVGQELRTKGMLAIFYAMVGILIYVTWRFEFRFALGAIVALMHDVLITLGLFSLFGREIDLPIVAAFLAIIGYSLNDTIIVYDRIRENMAKNAREGLPAVINKSINQTLSRTLLTSGTTLMVVLALFIFGGGVIHNFAFALLIGVIVGTYSSIFVASPILIFWENWRPRKEPQTDEVAEEVAS